MREPGPIAGFYARVKARRGHSIAIVAARKLACRQRAYERMVADWQQKKGAAATAGRALVVPRRNKSRSRPEAPGLR